MSSIRKLVSGILLCATCLSSIDAGEALATTQAGTPMTDPTPEHRSKVSTDPLGAKVENENSDQNTSINLVLGKGERAGRRSRHGRGKRTRYWLPLEPGR
jgi:hypothetical protein